MTSVEIKDALRSHTCLTTHSHALGGTVAMAAADLIDELEGEVEELHRALLTAQGRINVVVDNPFGPQHF